MDIKIKKTFLEWLNDRINDRDYTEIDVFVEEHDLDEQTIDELLSLEVVVREKEAEVQHKEGE